MTQGIFVGRQPIVDRDQKVVAYELLFRASATATRAEFDEMGRAAVRVMVNTFASLGMEAVLGESLGFFNVTREVFLSDALEALPRDRVVIEILENVEPDDEVVARCRALHEAGFLLALDDWVVDDPREPLLRFARFVKVDLPAVERRDLRRLARALRRGTMQLLAEKVETREEFEACRAMGFDLFQGYFFARPVVLEGVSLDAAKTTLIQLLQQVTGEVETRAIVETFKQDGKLGLNLLRLVNTAGRAARVRFETIEDAVRHLGRQQLGRWVAILLYAQGDDGNLQSPLLTTAAHRGRLMELIVASGEAGAEVAKERERAFLVGMLSMVDALLGRPLETLVGELRLSEDMARALIHHEGPLGELLSLVESIERAEVDKFESRLESHGLDLEALQALEHEAYDWVHGLLRSEP
ncbi:MAG: EAL domain-containing protein [Spirochaetaceae bacterium]|nr:EAL domain-containing protein [Myxococcales bacterium]MCB9723549.1 EAL domain-containing protein [Spirochaetaceae bacterium]